MRKTKSYLLESILEQRIAMGDYALLDFPAERKLAASFQVTQMTARKAVKNLERRGLLRRRANGTVTAAGKRTAALLLPTFHSAHMFMCQEFLERAAAKCDWQLRSNLYVHWDDAIIEETLERFDGVFIYPVREAISERMIDLLQNTELPIAALNGNMSEWHIPSFLMEPADAADTIIDHLLEQGYKRIDFLLTQPPGEAVGQWLADWRNRRDAGDLTGKLFQASVESYGNSYQRAMEYIGKQIEDGEFTSQCLLGATVAEAVGACRALASHGIVPGKDVAVACVVKSPGAPGEYFIPSLTAVEHVDYSDALCDCLRWMENARTEWVGPLIQWGAPGRVIPGESVIPIGKEQ